LNWSKEKYVIIKVKKTIPVTYDIKQQDDNEIIIGSFYSNELALA